MSITYMYVKNYDISLLCSCVKKNLTLGFIILAPLRFYSKHVQVAVYLAIRRRRQTIFCCRYPPRYNQNAEGRLKPRLHGPLRDPLSARPTHLSGDLAIFRFDLGVYGLGVVRHYVKGAHRLPFAPRAGVLSSRSGGSPSLAGTDLFFFLDHQLIRHVQDSVTRLVKRNVRRTAISLFNVQLVLLLPIQFQSSSAILLGLILL